MRFAVVEQARNRLALILVVLFVPLWTTLAFEVVARLPLRFYVRPVGRHVVMDGNILTQVTGALQALALVVGFMMFVATARSVLFDRRLVQAGYPRSCLAVAKCSSLVLVAAAVAVYATAWVHLFWRPVQPVVFAAGMFTGALVYGGIGIVLAAVLRSELAGMFLAIMISSIDLLLQNPLINPNADSALVRYLPAYGAVQSSVAAAGLHGVPWSGLLLGAGWALGTAALGMAAFAVRTRTHSAAVVVGVGVRAELSEPGWQGLWVSEQGTAGMDSAEHASGPAHLGHAAREFRSASRGEAPVAWLVSEGFEPKNWMVFLTVLLGWHADGFAGAGWGLFAAVFTAVLPTLILGFGERHHYWGDRQVRRRQDRVVAAPGVLASVIVGTALLFVLGAPSEVSALVAAMLAVLLALLVITFSWKVSVHAAVAAGANVILVSVFGPWAGLLVPVVALIGWSRIRLRCHTAAQVIVGAITGATVGGVAFGLLR